MKNPWTLLAFLAGCSTQDPSDPLSRFDKEYTEIRVRVGAAERDVARNVRNKEARSRLVSAEQDRVGFFRDARFVEALAEARGMAPGSLARAKADAYHLEALRYGSWTEEEKAEESRLLGLLEETASESASWSTPDGSVVIDLNQGWDAASKYADDLSEELRAELYTEYTAFHMEPVDGDLQALVHQRNAVAARAGYSNYWELSLATYGLTPQNVEQIIEELQPIVTPAAQARQAVLQASASELGVALNHANLPLLQRHAGYAYVSEEADDYFDTDLAEERITTAFQAMGLPAGGWQVYTEPRRHARSGVYGFPIRPPNNVAIVISQDRRWSVWQYEALAHEGGHAVWWQSLTEETVKSPPLWSPAEPWFEGFAHLFERIVYDPAFMARYIDELPEEQRERLSEDRARRVAEWIIDGIVDTQVERRLYEDPSDLVAVSQYAAQLRAELTGIPFDPNDDRGLRYDGALISSLGWNYPGYSPNFLYAYSTESWLYTALQQRAGGLVDNPQVGQLLTEHIIQAAPHLSFTSRMANLQPGVERADALREYIEPALRPPPQPPQDIPEEEVATEAP